MLARTALHDGLIKFDQARGYRGPVTTIDISGDWGEPLGKVPALADVPEWRLAVVLDDRRGGAHDRLAAADASERRARRAIASRARSPPIR